MAAESALIAEYLYGKINVSAVTNALGSVSRIYDTDVPQEAISGTAIFPCVVYQQQSAVDSFTAGNMGARIFQRPLWTVKVIVDEQTYKTAEGIYQLVDAAIQGTSGTVTNGSIYSCYREDQNIRYSEAKLGGGYFRHVGGTYRLEARATQTP